MIYLPRFGANATSCTASVIAISVSTLCHFLYVVKKNFQYHKLERMLDKERKENNYNSQLYNAVGNVILIVSNKVQI